MQTSARALILSRPAVIATLLAAFGLVVGSVAFSALSSQGITQADTRAAHARESLVLISRLLATINEAETAQRGYLLTRDAKYLAPYEVARPRYPAEIAGLRLQYRDDPATTKVVVQLSELFDQRFAEIARTIRLLGAYGIAPALNVVESDEGWRLMNEIRHRLEALQRQELAEVAAYTTRAAREASLFQRLNVTVLALASLLAGAVAWVVIGRLHQLEGLIKVCAWTHRVEWRGQWITFEEYLARRFNIQCTHGISEQAAEQLGREIAETPVPPEP